MKNLIPYFVIEQFKQQNLSGSFQAASLFIDISGFTKTTEALMQHGQEGAEMLADVMQGVFEPLVESVYAQGGFITGFAGDAFTALFPKTAHPVEIDDCLLRTLAAARRIQDYMAANPIQSTPRGDFSFAVKVGFAEGQVNWGILLPNDPTTNVAATYYFSGPAVDDCANAEHYANSGDLILTSAVYASLAGSTGLVAEAVEDHFRVTAALEGLPAPQRLRVPLANVNLLTTFIEPAILHQKTRGEFRHVLTVFLQLKDLNDAVELNRFVQAIFELQQQYGGHLNAIDFGDKGCNMLLFWGMPTSFENDIERALNFTLALSSKTSNTSNTSNTSITFRAGITYRLMYAGLVGASLRRDYSCYGRGVNLAARHMVAAPWGGLWLDEEVSKRAAPLFKLSFEGDFKFKGFARKLPVHSLVGQKNAIQTLYVGDMVGRQAEIARLIKFVEPTFAGRFAGLMLIQGETGIGKSRLVHTFQMSKALIGEVKTVTWFLCQTDQILRHSLNPFRYWLRHYFFDSPTSIGGGREGVGGHKALFEQKLAELIAETPDPILQQELERTRSLLGALVDLHWTGSLYEQLEPKLRFNNTLDALKTLIKAESLSQPVVMLLEDVHWLDPDSVQFIQQLTRNIDDYPIAIIATARPDFSSGVDKEKGLAAAIFGHDLIFAQEIILSALEPAALSQLANEVLGTPAAPSLVELLAERTDGNPFFAQQILLYLRDEGGLSKTEAGFIPSASTEALLPADVRALLVARLDRLTQEVKDTVQTASVLGREFSLGLLSQMLRDERIMSKVSTAEQAAIWSALSLIRYLFKQALLRDTAYDMQLRAQQRKLHQLAAETIESVYPRDLTPHYGELAYHYGQAQNEAKEGHYAKLAGEHAASQYANDEAISYFSRALDLTPESDLDARYDLLLAREAVYDWQGKREAQTEDLDALANIAVTLDDEQKQAQVSLRQANYARMTGDYPNALSAAQEAIAHAELVQDLSTKAEAYHLWGRVLSLQGNYDPAQEQLEQALTLAQTSHNRRVEADSLLNLGNLKYYRGNYTAAPEYYQKAIQIYQAINYPKGEATCLMMLAAIQTTQGEYLSAEAYNNQALTIYQQIGYRLGKTYILGNLGANYCEIGDYQLARHYQKQALTISQEIGDREGEGITFCNLVLIHYNLGHDETAQKMSEHALTVHHEIGDRRYESYTLTYVGHTLMALNQLELATEAYQKARDIRRELGEESLIMDDLAGLARVAMKEGNISQALSYVEEILTWIKNNGVEGIEYPLQVYLTCYQVLRGSADDEREVDHLAARADTILVAAHTLLEEQAAKIKDEGLRGKFLENVSFNREIQAIWEARNEAGSTANEEKNE